MASNSLVVRLNGDSSNLEAALNSAREGINRLTHTSDKLEQIGDKFKRITSSSASLRKKIADIKKAMEKMAVSGIDATDEGKEMWQKLSEAAKQYQETLNKVNQSAKVGVSEMEEQKSQADQLKDKISKLRKEMEELALAGQSKSPMFDQMAQQVAEMEKQQKKASEAVNNSVSKNKGFDFKGMGQEMADKLGVGQAFNAITTAANPAMLAITATAGTMIAAGKAATEFETHLNSLQALTGLTDKEMRYVADGAIEMSKSFKSSAGEIVDAMKLIGSQAPELLKDSDALMKVTEAANVLSEAAEISVEDAAKAITGTMNQMGASASEATDIINAFAAASQQGSADVAYLNRAFEKSGTAAASAGMDYVQLASAIESVAPKFSSADVAGSQLASTLLKLSMSGKNDFTPSVVGMSKALENLAKAEMSDAEMKNLVGESNITMLKSLIQAREQFDLYSDSLRGTNTAYEQMRINQKGFEGSIGKAKAAWEAFLLTLGNSGVMDEIMGNVASLIEFVGELCNVVSDIISAFDLFGEENEEAAESTSSMQRHIEGLTTVIRYLGDAIEILVALTAKACKMICGWWNSVTNTVESGASQIKGYWGGVVEKISDIGFVKKLIEYFNLIQKKFLEMVNKLKGMWNSLMGSIGMEDKKFKIETATSEIKSVEENKTVNSKTNSSLTASTTTADKPTKTKAAKSAKTEKIDYLVSVDDKSLDTAEKKLSAWQNRKKTLRIDDAEGLKEADEQIRQWQDEVAKRKLIIEFGGEIFDSLTKLQSNLKELEEKRKDIEIAIEINSADIENELDKEIDKVKSDILIESIKIGLKPEIEKGSKADIENEIKKLEEVKKILFQTNADPSTLKRLEDETKVLKEKLEAEDIRLGIKTKVEDGSLNLTKEKIKKKEEEISLLLNTNVSHESIRAIQKELDDLRKEEREKSIELGITKNVATIERKSESWERGSVEDKKTSIANAQSEIKDIQQSYRIGLIGRDEAISQINEINSKLQELGLKPIEIDVRSDKLLDAQERFEKLQGNLNIAADTFGALGSAASGITSSFSKLGDGMNEANAAWVNFAGQSLNATSSIIQDVMKILAAKQAEATANAMAGASIIPFPAAIPAMISIMATITSLFASLPKFEQGGIVGGASFKGDRVIARLNSGEGVLTRKGISTLYNSMDRAEIGKQQSANTLRGDVKFEISGSALKGCLRNYDSKINKLK